MNFFIKIIFTLIIFNSLTLSQNKETRISDEVLSYNNLNNASATYNLPMFLNNSLDNWTSSRIKFFIDGISFDELPLNFKSPNLLPIDYLYVKEINLSPFTGIKNFSGVSKGYIGINHFKEIPDSFVIKIHSYIGSETGDPLIHVFTRENLKQGNKNKIPLSGSFAASNKISDLSYRFSLGYYGSFSTGSINDNIIGSKSTHYSGKQNKQISGNLLLQFKDSKKEYSLSASAITYYGWDVPPFISAFTHFESYLYSIRGTAKDIIDGLTLSLMNNASVTSIHKVRGMPAAEINLSKYALLTDYNFRLWDINFGVSSSVNLNLAGSPKKADSTIIKFFKDDYKADDYEFFISSFLKKKNFFFDFKIGVNYTIKDEFNFSADLNFGYFISKENLVSIEATSVASSPNLTELYGSYLLNDFGTTDTFTISGNNNLISERNNHLGLQYSFQPDDNINFNLKLFAERNDNPIKQNTLNSKINNRGEIYRDAVYINASSKNTAGIIFNFSYSIGKINFFSSFTYTDNSSIPYYPRILLHNKLIFNLPINSDLHLAFKYSGKTKWEDFEVESINDEFSGEGYSGEINENFSFDLNYYQYIKQFYFLHNVKLGFTIQNIFNNKVRYLPVGNFLERRIIFSFSSEI